jgi:hypothetical protein
MAFVFINYLIIESNNIQYEGSCILSRIGQEAGEYFERIVETVFRAAGFKTERDKLFPSPSGVRHEIDVWATSNVGRIAVECKDWALMTPSRIKKELDAFRIKIQDIGAMTGIFVVNQSDDGRFQLYKKYLKASGLFFWDVSELDKWHNKMGKSEYRKELCGYLGLSEQPQTTRGKIFGLLKSEGMSKALRNMGKAAVLTANVAQQIGKGLLEDEKPRRKRKSSKKRRRKSRTKRRAT